MISTSSNETGDPPERTEHAAVILAAGRGTRMRSGLPKVLHTVAGVTMLELVARAVSETSPQSIAVTIGPGTARAREMIDGPEIEWAWQSEPDGTAGAVKAALKVVPGDVQWLLVVNGDVPLVTPRDLRALLERTSRERPLAGLIAFTVDDAAKYGRVLVKDGEVARIVEAADDRHGSSGPARVNSGLYCFDLAWLRESIEQVERSASGEYYLTSLIEMAHRARAEDERPGAIAVERDGRSLLGVDDRIRLADAEIEMQRRIQNRLMESGVTIVYPPSTYIEAGVEIGAETSIEPGVILRRGTRIGPGCSIGSQSVIEDSIIGEECVIRSSWIESSTIGSKVTVGPYAHLRPGTVLDNNVHIGNYVEIKNSRLRSGARSGHFSYLGDADIGREVNVGAGTITCNFDGYEKHRTIIGDHVFLGSDTLLIAPVEVGANARTGAGAVVTRSVPPGKTVVGMPARTIESRRAAGSRGQDS